MAISFITRMGRMDASTFRWGPRWGDLHALDLRVLGLVDQGLASLGFKVKVWDLGYQAKLCPVCA